MNQTISSATVTTGETYTGNQQFKGMGTQKWCLLCGCHKMPGGGHMRNIFGTKHWVCAMHAKAVAK